MKIELPPTIARAMSAWRAGDEPFPETYVDWHCNRARSTLDDLVDRHDLYVWGWRLEDSGWCDGMREVVAVVETRSHRLLKIAWEDSTQTFFHRVHGDAAMREEDWG